MLIQTPLLIVIGIIACVGILSKPKKTDDNKEDKNDFPTGYELLKELREINMPGYDLWKYDLFSFDSYIFREYVYTYEVTGGNTREVALRRAFEKYVNTHNT